MSIVVVLIMIFLPLTVRADVFVPQDRGGYYFHSPGLDARPDEKESLGKTSIPSGQLFRSNSLYDMDTSFRREFDESFVKDPSFDRYRAARNNLLLLEYSSPALADVIKHYRVLTAERLLLDQIRLVQVEQGSLGSLDVLRLESERACLYANQGLGLVKAMEKCKKSSQPFDALPLLGKEGSLADGRHNIHVVRDALNLLSLPKQVTAEKMVELCGDVVIEDDKVTELPPQQSFDSRVMFYRQKYVKKWQDALKEQKTSTELFLPGVPVTEGVIKDINLFEKDVQDSIIAKLSSYLSRVEVRREYREVKGVLEQAERQIQMTPVYKDILQGRKDYINMVIQNQGNREDESEGYRAMIAGIITDADMVRTRLLKENRLNENKADVSADALMIQE